MKPKTSLSDLALFGGASLFNTPVHVGCPNLGNRAAFLRRIEDMLDRRWLTNNGRYVQELEQRIARQVGVKHCIATCNATIALELVTRALRMDEQVIVPAFTFIATAHALQWQAAVPVFADIDPTTYTLDPREVERLITPHTKGIVGVHLWGRPCQTEALEDLARQHHIPIIFDAAHAFACTRRQRMVGSFGDAEIFSFHATKFINCGEGGAITTNNDALAEQIRLMKNFGFKGYDQVVYPGTNGKMSEMSAAMGLTNLESMPDFIGTNRRNYEQYREALDGQHGLHLVRFDESEQNNYQYIVFEFPTPLDGLTRDDLIRLLHAENVLARRYFYPGCHRMPFYRHLLFSHARPLPVTERLGDRVFALPTGTAVTSEDIARLCELVGFLLTHASKIATRMHNA